MQMMNKNGFSRCGENYINRLRKEGRYSTAHVYKNALYSFGRYCGSSKLPRNVYDVMVSIFMSVV